MNNSTLVFACIFSLLFGLTCAASVTNAEASNKKETENHVKTVENAQNPSSTPVPSSSSVDKDKTTPKIAAGNETCTNCSDSSQGYFNNIYKQITENKEMLLRTMYVLIGVTSIVIVYFVIKAWRLRRKRQKARKYGIITTPASDLEMAPLDQGDDDDDDEDMTVFEMNGKRRK